MSGGSWLRFVIGFILSVTVLISFIAAEKVSALSAIIAVIFIILGVLWFAFKF